MELRQLLEETSAQSALLKELLQVFEQETVEMAAVNISAMNISNKAKEELIARIDSNSRALERTISEFALREGLDKSSTLKAVAEHAAKRGNSQLLAIQQQLGLTADQIKQVATLNHEIAERFTESVTSSLNLITRLINQSNVYGSSGSYQPRATGAVMINREV